MSYLVLLAHAYLLCTTLTRVANAWGLYTQEYVKDYSMHSVTISYVCHILGLLMTSARLGIIWANLSMCSIELCMIPKKDVCKASIIIIHYGQW